MTASKFLKVLSPVLALAAGCQLLHPYSRPETATTGLFRDAATTDTTTLAARPW
jgi:outer membrane protein, multidrug efflux system